MTTPRIGFLAALLIVVACGNEPAAEHVGVVRQAQIPFPATAVVSGVLTPIASQEPSAAWANTDTFVTSFNVAGSGEGQGWATSTNNVTSFGLVCGFNGTTFAGPKGACKAVPTAGIPQFSTWAGDTTLVADGYGNLVYISLANRANPPGGAANYVAAVVSTDGGKTFDGATVTNAGNGTGGCGVNVGNDQVDQPDATFDYSTSPPTLWVAWRHRDNAGATWGACFRRGVIDTTVKPATIHWVHGPEQVRGLGAITQAALRIRAGDGVVTVIYNTNPNIPQNGNGCPDSTLNTVQWASVDTFNNGVDWTDNTEIFHSDVYRWCVLTPTTAFTSIRSFDAFRSRTGMLYVILNDSANTIRVFMSPAGGVNGWENFGSGIRPWFEWCSGTLTSNVMAGPTWNWKKADTGPCKTAAFNGAGGSVLQPSIAADGRGRVAVTYYESNAAMMGMAADTQLRVMYQQNLDIQRPGSAWKSAPLTAFFSMAMSASFGRPLGDYQAIAVKPSRDTRAWRPGCTDLGDFFPVWTITNAATGNVNVAARGVTP